MKQGIGCFVMGVVTGALGAVLYQRLKTVDIGKAADELSERLEDNVAILESRITSILGEAAGSPEPAS